MEVQERSEVREMIHGILDGWHEASVAREKLIYVSLNNIDSHLEKLNGKVAAHEKTILENLPHSINHCPQTKTIDEIKDAITGAKAVRVAKKERASSLIKTASFIVAALALCVTAYFGYINSQKGDTTIKKVESLGEPVVINPRGDMVSLPDGYTLKMFPNDFIKKDSAK
jgi:hypothetical protein